MSKEDKELVINVLLKEEEKENSVTVKNNKGFKVYKGCTIVDPRHYPTAAITWTRSSRKHTRKKNSPPVERKKK